MPVTCDVVHPTNVGKRIGAGQSHVVCVRGGLGPRSWWYIPKLGIHHQPKLPRLGPPGPASRGRIAASPPGPHNQSEHLTCGNDDRGEPEPGCGPGPDGGIRTAALHRLAGMVTASRCCPGRSRTPAAALRTSPDDLAAELNPHKTELNPHKAAGAAGRARTDRTGLPSSGQSPPARQLAKAELPHRPRSAVPITLRYRRGASLRTRSRRYGRGTERRCAPAQTRVQRVICAPALALRDF
jgi:hypothetical protein